LLEPVNIDGQVGEDLLSKSRRRIGALRRQDTIASSSLCVFQDIIVGLDK